jgi:CPA1 family monovalent cation:H+ antiporter
VFIGAVTSIFDTRLFHEAKGRPRVPRAISDTLKTRELVSRFFILATLALGEQALKEGGLAVGSVLENYVLDIPAGILLGVAVGYGIGWIRKRIDPAPVEIAVSIATPYVAALSAEALGISAVAAITTCAIVISAIRIDTRTGQTISSAEARVSATAFWEEANLMISSALFFLAGRALPEAMGALEAFPLWRLVLVAAALLAIVLGVQFAFSLVATTTRPITDALQARQGSFGRSSAAAVMAWASTRSVIGLVIALSVPTTLPDGRPYAERDIILILGALVVIGSVLMQGISLRMAVRAARLCEPGEEDREVELARQAIEEAGRNTRGKDADEHNAARRALLALRRRNEIGDEVLLRMLRETDLHARASEENVLPGAGPPNPEVGAAWHAACNAIGRPKTAGARIFKMRIKRADLDDPRVIELLRIHLASARQKRRRAARTRWTLPGSGPQMSASGRSGTATPCSG